MLLRNPYVLDLEVAFVPAKILSNTSLYNILTIHLILFL